MTVFVLQAGLSVLVLFLLVRWFIGPYLSAQPIRTTMLILLAPHVAHHVGLAVLAPGVVGAGFPLSFALIIAIGEPVMLLLMLLCMGALHGRSRRAVLLLWVFTAAGITYNVVALTVALTLGSQVVDELHAHWYVAVFYVPLLAVSHVLVLVNLLRRGRELSAALQ